MSGNEVELGRDTMIGWREQADELRDAVAGAADELLGVRGELRRIADALDAFVVFKTSGHPFRDGYEPRPGSAPD